MTERLYYTDAYLTEFDATVVETAEGGRRVYLDRSAFYPTSGGQPFDTGWLAGVEVVDVVDEDERVAHLLAAPLDPASLAARVAGRVDWRRRFDHMQQHTGQHLLSAVLAERFGYRTASVHFGRDSSTLDLDAGAVTAEEVREAEARANAIAAENRPVTVGFEDAAAADGLRKASDRTGTLRIVTIADLDRSACGGTHVRATGEIGATLIRKVERVRKSARLEFVCGGRAVERAREDRELLAGLAAALSAGVEEVPALVAAQAAQLKEARAALRKAEGELAVGAARELYAATAPDAAGVRRVVVRDGGSAEALRALAQAFTACGPAVLIGVVAEPPALLVAASGESGVDAAALLREALVQVGGRGGGSPRMAQGTAPDAGALTAALDWLVHH